MSTKDKATERPWMMVRRTSDRPMAHLSPEEKCGIFAIEGTLRIATIHGYLNQEEHNAALIVKAVNEYDALRSCERVLARICKLSRLKAPRAIIANESALGDLYISKLADIRDK